MTTPARGSTPAWVPHAKLVAVAFFWGSTIVSARVVAQSAPNFTAASGRFLLASLIFALMLVYRGHLERLNRRQWITLIVMGIFGVFFFNGLFFLALGRVPASKSALIVSLGPVMTAVAVALILRETLGLQRWAGILLALVGVNVIVTRGDPTQFVTFWSGAFNTGEGYMFLCVASWMVFTVLSRFALRGLSPLTATAYSAMIGTLGLLLAMLTEVPRWDAAMFSPVNGLLMIYIAVFGTVIANTWYVQGVQAIGPARTVVYTNLVPVFGVLLGYLILSEPIDVSMAFGGLIVIVGVFMTNRVKT